MSLRYLSVCSGIEAASVAWHPLGFQPVAFAEIEPFPSAVLAHHYPAVPNFGDLTRFKDWPDAAIDLLVGGTPCQSFSVAGLRAGLADPRGNLALTYLAIADRYRPHWLVWENVPGVLSATSHDAPDLCPPADPLDLECDGAEVESSDYYDSQELHAFNSFLAGLSELGYGFAYRTLDAQYFGLAQRRRRVFVVGHLGDWRRAAAVLFERESLSGHPAPRREAGQDVTGSLTARASAGGGLGTDFDLAGGCVRTAPTLRAGGNRTGGDRPVGTDVDTSDSLIIAHSLRADGFDASEDGTGRGTPIVPIDLRQASRGEKITNNRAHGSGGAPGHGVGEAGDPAFTVSERGQAIAFSVKDHGADAGALAPTLRAGGFTNSHANGGCMPAVAFAENQRAEVTTNDTAGSLKVGGGKSGQGYPAIQSGMQVRRLTPRECERLQGFPDDYTLIPYRGKPAADGPRYKALGNSMAVPVMAWIGKRIALVEEVCAA